MSIETLKKLLRYVFRKIHEDIPMHKLSGNWVCIENKETKRSILYNTRVMKKVHFLLEKSSDTKYSPLQNPENMLFFFEYFIQYTIFGIVKYEFTRINI